jgi:sterol desaturase/sphingolipid hydroxylase (fatty acid hydroxylase superfamily)
MLETYLGTIGPMVALSLLLLPLEWIAPAEPGQPAGRLLFNLIYGPLVLAFALSALIAVAPAYALVSDAAGGGLVPVFEGTGLWSLILFALAYGFAWDLIQYWLHRMQHAVPFLWEMHRFHHEETALNAFAYPRGHFLGVIAVILFNLPVVLLFGTRSPHAAAAFLMFPLWGYFTHANLRLGFGPLTPLLASPQWHRIHHSALPEHRDRNFSTLFPVIDIAFGTYHRPAPGAYPPTGTGGEPLGNLRGATIEPFVIWWRMLKTWRERSGAGRTASFRRQKA